MLPNCTCVCERPGHDRMAVLKGIVKMVRGEAGYICIYIYGLLYTPRIWTSYGICSDIRMMRTKQPWILRRSMAWIRTRLSSQDCTK